MLNQISGNETVRQILAALRAPGARVVLHQASRAGLGPFLATLYRELHCPMLFVGESEEKARSAFGDCALFVEQARFFPAREDSPLDDGVASGERAAILEELTGREKLFIFSTERALLFPTHAPAALEEARLSLSAGRPFLLNAFLETLEGWGFLRTDSVFERRTFAARGGIVDFFPPSSDHPYRVEWFGEEIDSIRIFDPVTQRSIQKIPALDLFPPEPSDKASATALDHLSADCVVVAEDAARVTGVLAEWIAPRRLMELTSAPASACIEWPFKPVEGPRLLPSVAPRHSGILAASFSHRFRDFLSLLREAPEREKIFIFTRQASRLREVLAEEDLNPDRVVASPLSRGFSLPDMGLHVYTDYELFGRVISPFRRVAASKGIGIEELSEGDIVVHARHGIARYEGLVPIDVQGNKQDYLCLLFARDDKLYVPLEEMDQVERYVGPPGRVPPLSRLGGLEWKSAKKKARKAAEEIAQDLVELYAARSRLPGHAYSPDTVWQREVEEAFPFEETPDQEKAVLETKQDMEKPRPMDRLIVGDVGYGKTEVALRAAFKAVMDGKQAAVLVPTTILAQQHYETFSERLATYPIKVEMLSRFKNKIEQDDILVRLFSGEIDILIGTHRMLQKDVHFKNLGLLVVDEEQRFGVAHKEALKRLKENVDCLTLSATPIPRTFYLSLVGVRDISVIDTPPGERLPVKTFVTPRDPALIRRAIRQELAREGQVYYLHNRVETLKEMERELSTLVPEARVISAHGKMKGEKLEEVMWEFMKGLYDVLLCTTIIENGLDIPRVNTLIVEHADRLGLAQMYQLRGRVGRSDRQAYAYFFAGGDARHKPTPDAEKRLAAIQEFTPLGSGYHIALKDLEIRGAGNLLGLSQHGHLASVGYHLYCQMLSEEVKKLKGKKLPPPVPGIHLDLPIPAFIPDAYVPARPQKLDLYRRLAACKSVEEVGDLFDEAVDRYGDPPAEAWNLFELMRLRIRCIEQHVYEIVVRNGDAVIRFWDGRPEISIPFQDGFPVKVGFELLQSKIPVVQ